MIKQKHVVFVPGG